MISQKAIDEMQAMWPPGRNCSNSYGLTARFLRRPSSSKHRL
jgi:hypothetical protein